MEAAMFLDKVKNNVSTDLWFNTKDLITESKDYWGWSNERIIDVRDTFRC